MKKIDHSARPDFLGLDGQALRLFLAVIEEGSVTAAATRLGLTQSAVSHNLQKLRRILHDPLFVKSGRGIVATAHAQALAEPARRLLDQMKDFARGAIFDPAAADLSLTIAANDFQRDLLLPRLFRSLEAAMRRIALRAIPSALPNAEMLRENRCDLLITPYPPSATDILQKRLLTDRYVCYYDPKMRAAPRSLAEYRAARHVTVVYPDNERLQFDRQLEAGGILRDVAVSVPSFSGVPAFLRGSAMLATMPSLLQAHAMQGFAVAPLPFEAPLRRQGELPMYMAWHQRYQRDPAHAWLRGLVEKAAADARRETGGQSDAAGSAERQPGGKAVARQQRPQRSQP